MDEEIVSTLYKTDLMNPIDLACTFEHVNLIKFFLRDCNMISCIDLGLTDRDVFNLHFLMSPIFKKNEDILQLILQYVRLDFRLIMDLLVICKNIRWLEGIQTIMNSYCFFQMFSSLDRIKQN